MVTEVTKRLRTCWRILCNGLPDTPHGAIALHRNGIVDVTVPLPQPNDRFHLPGAVAYEMQGKTYLVDHITTSDEVWFAHALRCLRITLVLTP